MDKNEIKTHPKITDRLWEIVKNIEFSRLNQSWFKSITVQGDLVILNVYGRHIHQVRIELREYESYNMDDMLKHRYPNWTNPPGYQFAIKFGPFNFIICASEEF